MNVFNELFANTKAEFPEQQQLVDTWSNSLENFKKQIKYLGGFLLEITNIFEQYGRQIQKSGKNLIFILNKSSTQNSKNLSECIKKCGTLSEMLGGVYSRSSLTLNSSISHKISKICDTVTEIKKSISDESTHAIKELSQSKISHLKVKVKYEKAKKELETSMLSAKKIKSDPASSYQPAVVQRAKEKLKSSKQEVTSLLNSLNEHVGTIHEKNDILETLLYNLNSNSLAFEKDSIQLLHEITQSVIEMLKNIIILRKEQASLKQDQLAGLANITLDMVGGRESETNTNTLEYLSIKLDTRLTSCEDRLKVLKSFKSFIAETIQSEETLAKTLEKSVKSLTLPDYFASKQASKSSWDSFTNALLEICWLHLEQSKMLHKKANEPVNTLLASQGSLNKNLQLIVQKIIKDHALVHEECLRDFERLKRGPEDANFHKRTSEIREKMLHSNQNTEHQVLTSLAENSNQEAGNLQALKVSLIHIFNMEESFNESLTAVVASCYHFLDNLNVGQDFKDMQVYVRKSLPMVASVKEPNHAIESAEAEEDRDALSPDNFLQKFGLKSSTTIIESFSCALSQKILLHGRMYLTTTHICFHSYFNSTTIFGRETLISIPLSEITAIEKRTSALIFDNALSIVTNSSNFMFKSFLYREQAYATLENLLKMTKPVSQVQSVTCEFAIETRDFRLSLQKHLLALKLDSVSSSMVSSSILKNNIIEPELELAVSPQQAFLLLFSDEACSFMDSNLTAQGNTGISIANWAPGAPNFYAGTTGDMWNSVANRVITYTHPVRERIPMMPKTCSCQETQTIYFLSKQEFIIDSQIKVSGVPLSDCFLAYLRFKISGEEKCRVQVTYGVEFLKSTMFRSKIETSGVEETKNSIGTVWVPMARRKVQASTGGGGYEPVFIPPPLPIEEKSNYFMWGLGVIFGIVVFYLWIRIRAMQSQIDEMSRVIALLRQRGD